MKKNKFDLKKKLSYKPSPVRVKIYLFLEKNNLLIKTKKIVVTIRKLRKKLGIPSSYVSPQEQEELKKEEKFHKDFEDFIKEIKNVNKDDIFHSVIFSGYISSYTKGGNHFLTELFKRLPQLKLIALSQSGKKITEREKEKIAFDIWTVPRVPFLGGYDEHLDIHLSEEMQQLINEKKYLQDAVYNIKSYHDDFGKNYAEALVYYAYQYAKALVESFQPVCVIVHNKLYSMHDIIVNVCMENKVKPLYFEFGALPGTFALENKGQMGASEVAVDYEAFKKLPVTKDDLKKAQDVWEFLKKSKLNRNPQTSKSLSRLPLKKGRPIILFAGQNDYDSGICPYTEYSRKYHSPIFHTSDEAIIFLAQIAEQNNWNLIYKPHPLAVKHHRCLSDGLPKNIIWISDVDINKIIDISDVVVTILSQVGDISLIRGKATVMLGYTQLRGKDCVYEAYRRECIEEKIKDALKYGFTAEQKRAFVRHIAQTIKYYLYDDLNDRNLRFGQDIDACAEYVKKEINLTIKKTEDIEKNGLVICRNFYDFVNAYRISRLIPLNITLNIFIRSINTLEVVQKSFSSCSGEIVSAETVKKTTYDYIFMPGMAEMDSKIYTYVCNNNQNLGIYIYDKGDIYTYCTDYKRISSEDLQKVRGIITLRAELNIWKYKKWSYHSIEKVDLSPIIDRLDMKVSKIKEKYIYLESRYFDERKYTNEIDLLDEIAEKVGKENIVVKLYTKESFLRFSLRGYRTIFLTDDEWFAFCISTEIEKHYLISVYPHQIGYYLNSKSNFAGEIYLYKMLVGKIDFITSNSFRKFMEQYKKYLDEKGILLYLPDDADKLYMTLNYIEG